MERKRDRDRKEGRRESDCHVRETRILPYLLSFEPRVDHT